MVLETYTHSLFNTGFPNQKAFILLYLLKWQYFWWFGFSYVFFFYYNLIFNKLLTQSLRQNPKISTTSKSHGKWGDVIICLLPVFWCLNILTSSNSLMKSIEWQTESCLMVVRVRAKQWYWTYKIALDDVARLLNTNLIIGSGKKISLNNQTQMNKTSSLLGFFSDYQTNKKTTVLSRDDEIVFLSKDFTDRVGINNSKFANKTPYLFLSNQIQKKGVFFINIKNTTPEPIKLTNRFSSPKKTNFSLNVFTRSLLQKTNKYDPVFLTSKTNTLFIGKPSNTFGLLFFPNELKFGCFTKNQYLPIINKTTSKPFSSFFFKNTCSTSTSNKGKTGLWKKNSKACYFFSIEKNPVARIHKNTTQLLRFTENQHLCEGYRRYYSTIKQVRGFTKNYSDSGFLGVPTNEGVFAAGASGVRATNIKGIKPSLIHNQRLLEVSDLLVLPTKTGLTLITNSYDVVHSWFIPGLGLKMDCVPGRSTHHSLYVRTPGFYYGQCAEICGRLHHHMPIKVCFVPIEHFFVWWNHFHSKHLKTPVSNYYRLN